MNTGVLVEGSTASLTGDIVDPGLLDGFTLSVTWGDGEQDILELSAGTTEFDIVHRYTDDGVYNIDVALVDEDLSHWHSLRPGSGGLLADKAGRSANLPR